MADEVEIPFLKMFLVDIIRFTVNIESEKSYCRWISISK